MLKGAIVYIFFTLATLVYKWDAKVKTCLLDIRKKLKECECSSVKIAEKNNFCQSDRIPSTNRATNSY